MTYDIRIRHLPLQYSVLAWYEYEHTTGSTWYSVQIKYILQYSTPVLSTQYLIFVDHICTCTRTTTVSCIILVLAQRFKTLKLQTMTYGRMTSKELRTTINDANMSIAEYRVEGGGVRWSVGINGVDDAADDQCEYDLTDYWTLLPCRAALSFSPARTMMRCCLSMLLLLLLLFHRRGRNVFFGQEERFSMPINGLPHSHTHAIYVTCSGQEGHDATAARKYSTGTHGRSNSGLPCPVCIASDDSPFVGGMLHLLLGMIFARSWSEIVQCDGHTWLYVRCKFTCSCHQDNVEDHTAWNFQRMIRGKDVGRNAYFLMK